MAASFRCVTACSKVQQHGEISIIHLTFILILFLPFVFWFYSLIECVYKSSTLFLYSCLSVLFYILPWCQHIHVFCLRQTQDVRSKHNYLARGFWEISTCEIIFSKLLDLFFSNIYFSSNFTSGSNNKFTDLALFEIRNSKNIKVSESGQ